MVTPLTIQLDDSLARAMDDVCAHLGKSRAGFAYEAIRRHVALMRFEQAREAVMPFAEARGYVTDEDIFRAVS